VAVLGAVALAFIPQAGSLSPFADDVADPEASVNLDTVIDQDSFADVDLRYRITSPRELTGPLRLFVDLQTPVRDKGPLADSSINRKPAVHASVKAGEQVLAEAQTPLPLPTPDADIRLNLGASTWEPASGDPTEPTEGRRLEDSLQRYGLVIGSAGPDSVTEGLVTLRLAKDAEPPLKVNIYMREFGTEEWRVGERVEPGASVDVLIRAENQTSGILNDMIVGSNLANYLSYVPGSTVIFNDNHPHGIAGTTNNVATGGIDIGGYERDAVAYVKFTVEVASTNVFEKLGMYSLRNIGIARAGGSGEIYNVGTIEVVVS